MDFQKLLKKYIQYVIDAEGISFITEKGPNWSSGADFTDEEWAELVRLEKTIYPEER